MIFESLTVLLEALAGQTLVQLHRNRNIDDIFAIVTQCDMGLVENEFDIHRLAQERRRL